MKCVRFLVVILALFAATAAQAEILRQDEAAPSVPPVAEPLAETAQTDAGNDEAAAAAGSVAVAAESAAEGGKGLPLPQEGVEPGTDATKGAGEEKEPFSEEAEQETVADPLEPWNRAMFTFNDRLYFWVLKPVAQGWAYVLPQPARVSIRNFFTNAMMPVRLANCLLQLKVKGAGLELARFGINTTIGLAGLFDIAQDRFNIYGQKEDLGQTLGYYGMGGGFYIVWPFLGSSTARDTVGAAGDAFLNPINYFVPVEAVIAAKGVDVTNDTSLKIGDYEEIKKSSVEPYVAIRDGYVQLRKRQIEE